jgi:TatD DNase family protein
MRGKRNESNYVSYVRDEIASLRGISKDEVENITTANAVKLFKISEI